jgi:hypothetical protein
MIGDKHQKAVLYTGRLPGKFLSDIHPARPQTIKRILMKYITIFLTACFSVLVAASAFCQQTVKQNDNRVSVGAQSEHKRRF